MIFEALQVLDYLKEEAFYLITWLGLLLTTAFFGTEANDNGMFHFAEHTKNKGSSTKDKHEKGQARQKRDQERSEGLKNKNEKE